MNINLIVFGVAIALIGLGLMILSSALERLVKSGEISAERLVYFSTSNGQKFPLFLVLGLSALLPGLLLITLGVVEVVSAS